MNKALATQHARGKSSHALNAKPEGVSFEESEPKKPIDYFIDLESLKKQMPFEIKRKRREARQKRLEALRAIKTEKLEPPCSPLPRLRKDSSIKVANDETTKGLPALISPKEVVVSTPRSEQSTEKSLQPTRFQFR